MPSELPPTAAAGSAERSAEALRRIAFGPDSGEDERAAATRELARRASRETKPSAAVAEDAADAQTADAQAGPPREVVAESAMGSGAAAPPDATGARGVDDESRPAHRSIALVWLLPIVVASLAVGAVVGRSAVLAPGTAVPSPAASGPAAADTPRAGNLNAAYAQLAAKPGKLDAFPDAGFIEGQGLTSVRFIAEDHVNNLRITIWAATNLNDDICLIAGVPDGIFASQCAPPKEFAKRGITLGFNGFEVSWDGVSSSAVSSVSGPLAAANGINDDVVPVVGKDTNIPVGDLDAAQTLFAAPAGEQPRYPYAALLTDLQASTVRYLGGDLDLVRAWVAEDEGQICLLLDQNGEGTMSCAPDSDFVSRGIALGAGGVSASWNGRDWALSSPNGYSQGQSG